ncbi:Mitochondrial matrix cochaperone [Orbilia ellipsospora]|uniref:GrpE protein homolog n=1 Tax=Orbilia ellipsospora TaxID=2528407 RepID=A0AAV9X4X5_9PEZI
MLRRSILSQARARPFSSLTTAATRSPSVSSSIPPPTTTPKVLPRYQSPLQWRNATVLSRWSSTEASSEKPAAEATPAAEGAKSEAAPATDAAKIKQDLEAKTKEAADLKDKLLRSVAEFRNLQERTVREVKAAKDFAIQKFARDLLESIDNLDRALTAQPSKSTDAAKDFQNLHDGLKMTETVLMNTLKRHGLERVDPMGEKFDPNVHEAIFEAPMEGKEAGTVFHVQSKGFSLNGRVLRAAKVGVVKSA